MILLSAEDGVGLDHLLVERFKARLEFWGDPSGWKPTLMVPLLRHSIADEGCFAALTSAPAHDQPTNGVWTARSAFQPVPSASRRVRPHRFVRPIRPIGSMEAQG